MFMVLTQYIINLNTFLLPFIYLMYQYKLLVMS